MSKLSIEKQKLLQAIDDMIEDMKETKQLNYTLTTVLGAVLTGIFVIWIALQIIIFSIIVILLAIPVLFLDMAIAKIRRILWQK
jgi:predicted esterase YcpF (UPF0227 family)